MITHAATAHELLPLTWFDDSGRDISVCVADAQDVLANWGVLGVLVLEAGRAAVLLERSELAIALVVGDGAHFGRARAPSARDMTMIEAAFAVRYAPGGP